ncbi:MAG: hypothetical protein ACI3XR_07165 [Eubacteriales bacterium]
MKPYKNKGVKKMKHQGLNDVNGKKERSSAKAEETVTGMKKYLANNANKIIGNAKRAVATGLVGVTLLCGMVGCNKADVNNPSEGNHTESTNEIEDGASHEPFEVLPIRPIEEIEESGITAEDVLAVYDKLALAIEKKRFPRETIGPDYLEAYDKQTAQFESITVETYSDPIFETDGIKMIDYQFPFFIKRNSFSIGQLGEQTELENKVYTCFFNYNVVSDNKYYNETFEGCGIIDYEFEDVMKSFNLSPSTITEDKLALGPSTDFFRFELGQTCYPPIKIDRELIQSANKEQLLSLYNMINSIQVINIERRLPDNADDISNETE